MGREPGALLEEWATARGRRELRELLGETLYFDIDELARRLHRPDCDPIDLLITLAWDWPLVSRTERVSRFQVREREYLDSLSPRARQILGTILGKYEAHGIEDLSPQVLQTAPLSELGSPLDLAEEFGGPTALHDALDDLGRRLFEAS
jgi:type I restriction enzyme R subunit